MKENNNHKLIATNSGGGAGSNAHLSMNGRSLRLFDRDNELCCLMNNVHYLTLAGDICRICVITGKHVTNYD